MVVRADRRASSPARAEAKRLAPDAPPTSTSGPAPGEQPGIPDLVLVKLPLQQSPPCENTPPSSYRDPPRVHGTDSIAARSVTALDPNCEGESISTMEAITLKEMALSLRNKWLMQFEEPAAVIVPDWLEEKKKIDG